MSNAEYDIPEEVITKCVEADKEVWKLGGIGYHEKHRLGAIAVIETFLEEMDARAL